MLAPHEIGLPRIYFAYKVSAGFIPKFRPGSTTADAGAIIRKFGAGIQRSGAKHRDQTNESIECVYLLCFKEFGGKVVDNFRILKFRFFLLSSRRRPGAGNFNFFYWVKGRKEGLGVVPDSENGKAGKYDLDGIWF